MAEHADRVREIKTQAQAQELAGTHTTAGHKEEEVFDYAQWLEHQSYYDDYKHCTHRLVRYPFNVPTHTRVDVQQQGALYNSDISGAVHHASMPLFAVQPFQ
jgi:hypothetical protein